MDSIQAITNGSISTKSLFSGLPPQTSYQWKNLIIEKRVSISWLGMLYKESFFYGFWKVLSSPVS